MNQCVKIILFATELSKHKQIFSILLQLNYSILLKQRNLSTLASFYFEILRRICISLFIKFQAARPDPSDISREWFICNIYGLG